MKSSELRSIWLKHANEQKEFLNDRIDSDIEKYRKGDIHIKLVGKDGMPISNRKIKITLKKHAFRYGANIFMLDGFNDSTLNDTYRRVFKEYFNLATIPFYWDTLEPQEGKVRFKKDSCKIYRKPPIDLCMEYCEENNIAAKIHCLVYDGFIPEWLPSNDMQRMEKAYEKRISEIARCYDGKFEEIEVLNELLCEHLWPWSEKSIISSKRDIIEWAFGLTRKYMPNDKLLINDYSGVILDICDMDYRAPYFMMIDNALKNGATIDKIGIQHHCFCGATAKTVKEYEKDIQNEDYIKLFNPEKILKGLDILSELNLPIEVTEVTVPTFGVSEEDELLQADLLDLLYSTFFSHPMVENIVYWNVPDGYAYVPVSGTKDENRCRGGLFNHDMTPKKSALRLYEMFNKRWNTDLELISDENGMVFCRGFLGEYIVKIDNNTQEFVLRKNDSKPITIVI